MTSSLFKQQVSSLREEISDLEVEIENLQDLFKYSAAMERRNGEDPEKDSAIQVFKTLLLESKEELKGLEEEG